MNNNDIMQVSVTIYPESITSSSIPEKKIPNHIAVFAISIAMWCFFVLGFLSAPFIGLYTGSIGPLLMGLLLMLGGGWLLRRSFEK